MKKSIVCAFVFCLFVLMTGCGQSAGKTITYENVDSVTEEADKAYEEGQYEEALKLYADAIKTNPVSVKAQVGAARCQTALKNYAMASQNLAAAGSIDPRVTEIYDAYVELAKDAENPEYAKPAVRLAKNNNVEYFLALIPGKPQFSLEEGSYNTRQELTITAEEGTEIFVQEVNNKNRISYTYTGESIRLLNGETEITAYCVKDGIPGENITAQYDCQYEPVEISFSDPLIEASVRNSLQKPEGAITDIECEGLSSLRCYLDSDLREKLEEERHTIESLEDLKYFPRLENFEADSVDISADLNELQACKMLDYLELRDCNISDISFVKGISLLTNIDLGENKELADISPLAACEELRGVRIYDTAVTDLSPLDDLELNSLSLNYTDDSVKSSILHRKDSLIDLELYDCGGKDLSWLKDCTGLEMLTLCSNQYTKMYSDEGEPLQGLDFLAGMTKLERLSLIGLDDVSPLEYCKKLKNLYYLYIRMFDREKEISEDMIRDLQNSLPNCSISY